MSNEAFARVEIDALLAAQGWDTLETGHARGGVPDTVIAARPDRSLLAPRFLAGRWSTVFFDDSLMRSPR